MNSKDSLGDRMKEHENVFRHYLPRRTNTIIRVDGKTFHSYTKGCKKPFDEGLIEDMDKTAIKLCEEIQGAKLAYVQSDEISIFVTDYDKINTSAWFDGNIQKICSVSASIATAEFNRFRLYRGIERENANFPLDFDLANFDARVFILPNLSEVANYLLWRCQDASRNSVQMVARSLYSHKECENKNNSELQEMIFVKGQNWNDLPSKYKRGRLIMKYDEVKAGNVIHQFVGKNWKICEIQDFTFNYWYGLINKVVPLS